MEGGGEAEGDSGLLADPRMAPVMAGVLAERGASALVFRGDDGLDELSTAATSRVWVVARGGVREDAVDPQALGIELAPADALRGADAAHNAGVARRVLAGDQGPVRDAVLLNAAAALAAYDGVTDAPVADQLAAMLPRAAEAVDSGAAAAVLDTWAATTRSLKSS
jgi:anthranilate phosphoribosyltransferase